MGTEGRREEERRKEEAAMPMDGMPGKSGDVLLWLLAKLIA